MKMWPIVYVLHSHESLICMVLTSVKRDEERKQQKQIKDDLAKAHRERQRELTREAHERKKAAKKSSA